ncbi:hypothetical protein [Candidatus Magnetomonas plexicatena]|uniref:hypothetical protein n=1 Tax=Candidatus Magnetomonas plexicatena TaxID=2552947 RepID=UPI001101B205|nr:hypothetical protein E2O03_007380 [Nitrospirales bacterium LBB_01]
MDISLYNIDNFKNTVSALGGGKRNTGGQNASSSLPIGQAIASTVNANIAPASIYTPPNLNELDQLSKSMLEAQQKQAEAQKSKEDKTVNTNHDNNKSLLNTSLSNSDNTLTGSKSADLSSTTQSTPPLMFNRGSVALNSYQSASVGLANAAGDKGKGSLVNISV